MIELKFKEVFWKVTQREIEENLKKCGKLTSQVLSHGCHNSNTEEL